MHGNINSFHILLASDECAVNISYSYAFSHDCNMITAEWEGVAFLGARALEVRRGALGRQAVCERQWVTCLQMALLRPAELTSSANLTLK